MMLGTQNSTLPPWSFTMLETFETCPFKAYNKYVLKLKEPETEAMRQGNLLDKAIEARILRDTPMPPNFAQYEHWAASVVNMATAGKPYAQLKLGIDRQFKAVPFFDANVWGRGALDIFIPAMPKGVIIDWKTGKNSDGKPWSNGGLQLKIFALLLFKTFPRLEEVTAFNIWLKDNKVGTVYKWSRSDEAALWREVLVKVMAVEKAFAENKWPLTPGPLCGYCPVKTCQFNRS